MRLACVAAVVMLVAAFLTCGCTAQTPAPKPLFTGADAVPSDATVLFDGKDLSAWVRCGSDKPAGWKIENGYAQVQGGSICTKQKDFVDYQLHVEFWLPLMADKKGQYRANSGVYLDNEYEVQVLDSYQLASQNDDCGSIYSIEAPMVNACRPPETWQTYDIVFHSPKLNDKGDVVTKARVTVIQNGVLIHDNSEIPFPTADHGAKNVASGGITIQDHGNPIRYRNVWIRPLN
jgi:hypothetical protein